MEITLKQPEIEMAVRQYIAKEVNLRNKTLAIDFTAGRGANGLSAVLVIETADIPGFTDPVADVAGNSYQAPDEDCTTNSVMIELVEQAAADLVVQAGVKTVEETKTPPFTISDTANPVAVHAAVEVEVPAAVAVPEAVAVTEVVAAPVVEPDPAPAVTVAVSEVKPTEPVAAVHGLFGKPAVAAVVTKPEPVIMAEAAPVEAAKPTTTNLFGTPQ